MEYFDPNKYVGGSKKSSTNAEKKSSTKLFDPMQYVDKSFIEEQQKQKQTESAIATATNKTSLEFNNELMSSAKPKHDFTQTKEPIREFKPKYDVTKRPDEQPQVKGNLREIMGQGTDYKNILDPLANKKNQEQFRQDVQNTNPIVSGMISGASSIADTGRNIGNLGRAFSGDSQIQQGLSSKLFGEERQNVMSNKSFLQNIPENIASSLTRMLPSIATGGTLGLGISGLTAGANNAQQALDAGATAGQAAIFGAGTGIAEALTERLGFMPGISSAIVNGLGKSASKNLGKIAGVYGKKMLQEGLEEVIMEPVTGALQKATYQPDKKMGGQGGVFDILAMAKAGTLGALAGGLMGGAQIPSYMGQSQNAVASMSEGNLGKIINIASQMPTQSKSFQVAQKISQSQNVTYDDYVSLVNEIKSDNNVGLNPAQASNLQDRTSIIQSQIDTINPVKLGKVEGKFTLKQTEFETAKNEYDAALLFLQDKYRTDDLVGVVSDIVHDYASPEQRIIEVTPEDALDYIKSADGIDMVKLASNVQKTELALKESLNKEIVRLKSAPGMAKSNIVNKISQRNQLTGMLENKTPQNAIESNVNIEGNFTPQQQENSIIGQSDASSFSGGAPTDNVPQNTIKFTLGEQKQIIDAGRKAYTTALQQKSNKDITRKQIEEQANIKKAEAQNDERNKITQSKQEVQNGTQTIQEPTLGQERQADSNDTQSAKLPSQVEYETQDQKNAIEGVKNYSPNTDVSGVKVVDNETVVQKSSREFVNSTLGLNVVFFEGAKDAPNGFYLPKDATTLYINADNSDTAIARSVSHESFHALKKNDPAKWNELVDYISENLEQKQFTDYANSFSKQEYTKFLMDNQKALVEEIAADEFANNFTDKTWWEELYNKNTSLFKKLMFYINKFLDKINAVEAKANNYLTTKQAQAFAKKQMEIMESVLRGKGDNVPSKTEPIEKLEENNSSDDLPFSAKREKYSGRRIAKDELAVKIELQDIVTDELKNAKDPKGMFAPSRLRLDSAQRVFERYFGKDSKAMNILQGGKTAEADLMRWQSETIKKIKDLGIKSNLYFIPGKKFLSRISKESQALMWYAEKMKGLDPYSIDELKADLPDTWQKIVDAEKVIRDIYDSTIKLANQKREALGYPPIPFRKNYIAHMQQANGLFEMFGVSGSDVPTAIAGMTDDFEPWKPFFANEFRRVTNETEVDAIGNTIRYINGIGRMIYMTEYINSLRMLEKGIRENYSQHQVITEIEKINELMKDREASGRARFVKYYEEEKELLKKTNKMTDNARKKRLEEVKGMKIKAVNETNEALKNMKARKDKFEELLAGMSKDGDSATHLSVLAGWLKEYTNLVAGKNARIDRITEELVRRKGYSWYQVIDRQLSSAYVGYNVGSATTNVIPLVNALSQINKISVAKGMFDAVRYWNNADGLVEKSDFLSKRLVDTSFTNTMWGKAIDYGFVMMRLVDRFAASTIFRAKYYEGLGQGKTEAEAIKQANITAEKIMADRSATNVPVLFKSKLANIVVKFQLEQVNNLQNIFGDNFKTDWSKDAGKLGKQLAEKNPATYNVLRSTYNLLNYFALAYVLNLGFLALLGRKPVFDLLGLFQDLMKIFGDEKETEKKKIWKAVKKFIEQIPFAQVITGGRVPLGGALPDLEDYFNGKTTGWTEVKKPLKLLLPGGGGQISKTIEGVETIKRGGYYKNTPSGEALQYSVEKTPANMAKAAIFGRSSLPETRKFYEERERALNAKQTIEQKIIGVSPEDYLLGRNLQTELGKSKTRVGDDKIKSDIVKAYIKAKDPTLFIATLDNKLTRTVRGDTQELELTDSEYQEYVKNIVDFSKKIKVEKANARTYDRVAKILNEFIGRQNKKIFISKGYK